MKGALMVNNANSALLPSFPLEWMPQPSASTLLNNVYRAFKLSLKMYYKCWNPLTVNATNNTNPLDSDFISSEQKDTFSK